ncbi:NTP transferase domain-containing protein [Brooklawnia sp.]|uniref:molybdenum cofactor guanylyltransferase n=1 Tax=Brooklawnia sp. TaxID=2699740 RepID=UPI00311FE862
MHRRAAAVRRGIAVRPVRAAIILAGGRSSRMGADKLGLHIDGRSLLQRAVAAGLAWSEHIVVAGPQPPEWSHDPRVEFVPEDPPFGGPVAGIAAALAAAGDADEVFLLAGDLAAPAQVVSVLADAPMGSDGVILEDADGWAQYLAGRYCADSVRRALGELGDVRNVSVRRALGTLVVHRVAADRPITADLDTPNDAKIAGAVDIRDELPRIDLPGRLHE